MKYYIVLFKITLLFKLISIISCSSSVSILVTNLTCEGLINPLGINTIQPRFSWQNKNDKQGSIQTAYQIIVAKELDSLEENNTNLYWNSNKVSSASNIWIKYEGEPLHSGELLYWKVRVWDENGNISMWSEPSRFSVGLLNEKDWSASYIGYFSDDNPNINPQIRKTFYIKEDSINGSFLLHVNSLGYHEIYLNGKKINDDVLAPAVSQFNKRSMIITYDITPLLNSGNNDLIIWLGSGWYKNGFPGVTINGPAVKAQIEHITSNNREIVLYSDASWKGRESEYYYYDTQTWGYGGELINGNLENRNIPFETPESIEWGKVILLEVPDNIVTPQTVEANKIKETISPIRLDRINDSEVLIDMGKSLTGWLEITFPCLEESQEILIEYSDHLDENNDMAKQGQIDKYIASGYGTEFFVNKFNYRGFRYVKIHNLKQTLEPSDVKAYLIHTDFKEASTFKSSDQDLNKIHDMINYTLKCVSLGGYLVDCPHLERLGYGGDGNASTISSQIMYKLSPFYHHWLQIWQDVMREDGSMPHTAPNPFSAGGGPYWCGFIISASWNSYQNYGDLQNIEKFYPTMQQWLNYVEEHSSNGLLRKWPNTEYRNWYLGDWATPEGVGDPNHIDERSVDLVNNCYISVCFDQMSKIARIINKTEDSEYYKDKKNKLNKLIHKSFYDDKEGIYATGSQIDMIFPLLIEATPAELIEDVTEKIKVITQEKYDGHLNTGLVGIPIMMEWASKSNQSDFIYSMLKKRTYPGYLYMIEQGATTTWEHWNGERSWIHNCYNGVGQWFYQSVGGIRSIPGKQAYSEFIIDPQIPKGVTWANTTQEVPNGQICVNWKLSDEKMTLEVKIPIGSKAKLNPPQGTIKTNIDNKEVSENTNELQINSGRYLIEYILK